MPHHLMPNVFGACFHRQLIVLDVSRDRYVILSPAQSDALAPHLGLESARPAAPNTPILKQMIDTHLVTAAAFPDRDPKLNTKSPPPSTGGMSADRWKLPDDAFTHRPAVPDLVRALAALRSVHGEVARQKLPGLLLLCGRAAQRGLRWGQPDDYAPLVNALNWACLLYPQSTKCLEWGAALTLLSARAGLALKLVIGVQSFPFYAHAWTEADGAIIGDSARRREEMSVILEAPHPLLKLHP